MMAMNEREQQTTTHRYDRDELVAICEAAVVPVDHWYNRDSAHSQEMVGRAWALLRAGAPFTVRTVGDDEGDRCVTDEHTIWLDITWPGFNAFEWGRDDENLEHDLFYLPTRKRLEEAAGKDWY